jgi:ribonuclease HI
MKLYIEWEYKFKKQSVKFTSEYLELPTVLEMIKDIEKTGRVNKLTCFDENHEEWTKKEIEKWLKSLETEPHNIEIYFDGGFHEDTKAASAGIVIYYEKTRKKQRVRKNGSLELIDSNNEAEYAALWMAITELENLGIHHIPIQVYGDSQVVINQITGEWPCYEEQFNWWIDKIEEKVKSLGLQCSYTLIGRNENKEADQLASQALKGIQINSSQQISP